MKRPISNGTWTNGMRSRFLVGGLLAAACLAGPLPARAVNPSGTPARNDRLSPADDLIGEALTAELDGRGRDREHWTQEALKAWPNLPAAHWLDGQVLVNRRWIKIDEAPSLLAGNSHYQEYLRMRSKSADTVADQLRLGDWCEKRRLMDQARAHLTRVIQLEPDHAAARSRLGYKRLGEQWYTSSEIEKLRERATQLNRDLVHWKPIVQQIRQALESPDSQRQEKAREQLRAIDTPAAFPALELVLAIPSVKEAYLAAEVIGGIHGPEASLSLARLAMFSDSDTVRQEATKQLKQRPLIEFVPPMLAVMSTALMTSVDLEFRGDGTAVLTQKFSRENQAATEASVLQTFYVGGVWTLVEPQAAEVKWQQDALASQYNAQLARLNARIAQTLNAVTDQQLSDDPKAWWSWWDDYNDVRAAKKPVVQSYRWQMRQTHSCFAAGTQVWTSDGPQSIERIVIGDRVLAQDVETGELAYKAVLRTTIGSPIKLLTVKTADDSILCTGGHAFWAPGSGWTHARKLDAYTRVHGVAGATQIDSVQPGPKEQTYNLVVADWNTYFVGHGKLLVHDVTLPGPTTTEVPGLKAP